MRFLFADHEHRSLRQVLLVLLAASVVFALPALFILDLRTTFDGHAHTRYLQYFAEAVMQGRLYPRWSSGMYAGCGDAAFFFYPPLSFYLALPFYLLTGDANMSYALFLVPVTWAAGLCMYRYLREFVTAKHALLGSVVYLFFPIRTLSYYVNGSPSEYLAYTAIPLALLAARRVARGEARYGVLLAAAMSFTLLSSVTATMIFMLVLIPCTLYEWTIAGESRHGSVRIFLGAALLSLALCLALLLPFFMEMKQVALGNGYSFTDAVAELFGLPVAAQLILIWPSLVAVGFLLLELFRVRRTMPAAHRHRSRLLLWICVELLFLMTPLSILLWGLPLFARFMSQTPVRIALCFAVVGGVAAAVYSATFRQNATRTLKTSLVLFIALLFLVAIPFFLKGNRHVLHIWELSARNFHEFLPAQVDYARWIIPHGNLETLDRAAASCREKTRLVSGDAGISVKEWRPYTLTLEVESALPSVLRLGLFHYRYWRVTQGSAALSAERETGQILLEVPPGRQTVTLQFVHPPYIAFANGVSLISWLIALLFLWRDRREFYPPEGT